jgi:CheY-like chemotaxis protein
MHAPSPSLTGIHAVIVDDHADTRTLVSEVLTYAGASVIVAASAREAASLLDGADVVVTDYAMPGETGLWLLERVRERRYPIPVIVVTGYADLYAKELRTAPFARVLGKPIDPWQLCETVAAVLRRG